MKFSITGLCALLVLSFFSQCKKNSNEGAKNKSFLIDESKEFFEKNVLSQSMSPSIRDSLVDQYNDPGNGRLKFPVWEKATEIAINTGNVVLVPVKFVEPYFIQNNFAGKKLYLSDDVTKLLIYKDNKGEFRAEKLTLLPDSNFLNVKRDHFTGIIQIETWAGEFLDRFKFSGKSLIEKYSRSSTTNSASSRTETSARTIIEICYESSGYNYASSDPNHGYFWKSDLGCQRYYLADPNNSATDHAVLPGDYGSAAIGGSIGGPTGARAFTVLAGENPVTNISQYLKCFTNAPGPAIATR